MVAVMVTINVTVGPGRATECMVQVEDAPLVADEDDVLQPFSFKMSTRLLDYYWTTTRLLHY